MFVLQKHYVMHAIYHRGITQPLFPDYDKEVQLVSTSDQAVLLYKGDVLIRFDALVRLSPEELFEYASCGVFHKLVSAGLVSRVLRSGRLFNRTSQAEPADHILYRPQWYTIYFISGLYFQGSPGDSGLPQSVEEIARFFVPGHALIDYANLHVFTHSLSRHQLHQNSA